VVDISRSFRDAYCLSCRVDDIIGRTVQDYTAHYPRRLSNIFSYILLYSHQKHFPKGVFILCLIQKYDDSILILLKFVKLIKGNFCIVQTK
jgi:hypothetical protein